MVMPAIKERILEDLDRLSPEEQQHAARLVHSLVDPLPKGASVDQLMTLAGTLDDESAQEMIVAIEEGHGLTLVTHDRHFDHVAGLPTETW
jgi:hypothetical protein